MTFECLIKVNVQAALMTDHRLHLGRLAGVWFFGWLFLLGALTPGYSQLTKAVSELGAFGAPCAIAMNSLGLGATGLLIACFGQGLRDLLRVRGVRSSGGWAVITLGVVFAGTAIPADFERRFESPWTIAHALFVLLGPVVFLWAALAWPRALAALGAPRRERRACSAAAWLLLPAFFSNGLLQQAPGLGQRLGFAVVFLWLGLLSHTALQCDGN